MLDDLRRALDKAIAPAPKPTRVDRLRQRPDAFKTYEAAVVKRARRAARNRALATPERTSGAS